MEKKKPIVNISLQVVPVTKDKDPYALVDSAISVIRSSGVAHEVCPMETVMEGDYDRLMELIKEAQKAVFASGADKILSFIKVEWSALGDISMEKKTKPWKRE